MDPRLAIRTRFAASAILAALLSLPCAWTPARAENRDDEGPPLTFEAHDARRDALAGRVLLVQAWPAPAPLEDPDLVPTRIGMAARVARDGAVQVWTAAGLVQDATRIRVSATDGGAPRPARVVETRDADGLARLECDGGCPGTGAAPEPAPAEACEDGRPLSFVVPAGPGGLVLGHTAIAGPESPPLEALVIVPGRLPEGTPLFDPRGRPAAIVLRPHLARTDRVLAAPLTPRPSAAPATSEPEPVPAPEAVPVPVPVPDPAPSPAAPAAPAEAAPSGLSDRPADGVPVMDLR
jgi:hypothetical protein